MASRISPNGSHLSAQAITRGVSEGRKSREEALRRSEEYYRNFFDNAAMGIYQSTPEGKILMANGKLARLLGYSSPDELLDLNLAEDIYRNKYERQTLLAMHESTIGPIELEVEWKRRDGTPVWVHLNSNAVKDERGRTLYFNGFAYDITSRKVIEESLRTKTQQLEAITTAMTASLEGGGRREVAAMLVRSALELTESENGFAGIAIDRQTLHLLAYESAQWGEEKIYAGASLQHHEEKVIELTDPDGPVARVISSGRTVSTDDVGAESESLREIPFDGVQFRQFLGVPILIGGEVIGIIGVANRASGYADAELKKLEILAQMAAVLFENYRRLQRETSLEEQLRQSQKIEAIGQLAGGVAHDFNNLLTAITGYSDLVMRRLPSDDLLCRHVTEIKRASDRAAALTRQLLAFSRKQILQPKVIDLNIVVRDIDKMLRRLIGEDIDLLTVLDHMLGSVKADPGQLEQVIINLAVNARDAMPKGGKLTIETANVYLGGKYASEHVGVRPGHYVMLAISDNGCGMDERVKARIFEPFFTTKELGKGTGLGLSTIYGIVKQSEGNIWVYSEPGRGTTFKVYLPRVDGAGEEAQKAVVEVNLPRGSETILLVEDEATVRELMRQVLEKQGYRVLEAANGKEAIELCGKVDRPIDLVITDVVMPQMGGRELIENLKPLLAETKVLYMSGYTDNAIVHHGVLDESMCFLEKPFTTDVLIKKVRGVLDER